MIKINDYEIALDKPTYFIADIAANHDKDLRRAKKLIELAHSSGANAVKLVLPNVAGLFSRYSAAISPLRIAAPISA